MNQNQENALLREALQRIANLTPERANAKNADSLYFTVKAIAQSALHSDSFVSVVGNDGVDVQVVERNRTVETDLKEEIAELRVAAVKAVIPLEALRMSSHLFPLEVATGILEGIKAVRDVLTKYMR